MRRDLEAFAEGKAVTATVKVAVPEDSTQVIRSVGVLERQAFKRPGWLVALALALLAGGLIVGTWSLVTLMRTVVGRVDVPRVVGKEPDQANRLLRAAGLDPSFQQGEFSIEVTEGKVTRQEPPSGRSVARGSLVRFWVSRGRPVVEVPEVIGETLEKAAARLREAGLTVGKRIGQFSTEKAGIVLEQNPTAGRELRSGDSVDLTVSQGEEKAVIPNVIGTDYPNAVEILANAGFRPHRITEPHPTAPQGEVFDQDPKPNSEAAPGSLVDVFVSEGPESFSMPDVVGLTEQDATDELESRGLTVRIVREVVFDESQRGRVIDQNPSAGTTVKRGDSVEITVGE
jgi:serine/threonine-protein kinase